MDSGQRTPTEGRPVERRLSFLLVLLPPLCLSLLCSGLFLYRLSDRPLNSSHEARAAQNAQTMLDDDDWLLPRLFDRRVELQKPPLYYWLVALIGRLQDDTVDGWAVRLPAALAAVAVVLALYGFCALQGRLLAGFVAAAVLATCCHFTWLARVGRIDMPLTLTVSLALFGFFLARRERAAAWRWLLLSYLTIAAGLLLKGPIATVLPAVVAGTVLLTDRLSGERTGRGLAGLGLWWGVPLVLALAGPWYVLADLQTGGDFGRAFFWHHNLERGFGGEGGPRARPWAFYVPHLLADSLPWSVFLPAAVWWLFRRGWWRVDAAARFGLAWLMAVVLLLSCMSFKRADYLLPAFPGAALLLGCTAERLWRRLQVAATGPQLLAAGSFLFMVVGSVPGWWVYLNYYELHGPSVEERFAAEVRDRADLPVIFFRVEDHELAFHVGAPIETLLEWENLDAWLKSPRGFHVVMPADCATDHQVHLCKGKLEEVVRSSAIPAVGHPRELVLLRPVTSSCAPTLRR